jgi:flagellar hook-associated protein 2
MSTTPLTFSGVSTFGTDFQTILTREQSIEKLAITALQNKQSDNLSKKQALVALDPIVGNLGSAVASLASMGANQGLSASTSDSSTVAVTNTGATFPASYTVSNILSLATAASETSLSGYADTTTTPVSTAGNNAVDLVVGTKTYHLDLTGTNNLTGLTNAINNAGAGVSASILTTATGNYLSISANSLGATTLTLNDIPATTSLISGGGTGTENSLVTYPDTGTTAVSTTGKMDFTVGSSTYHLDLTGKNNLSGLVSTINTSGAGVTASITNDGSGNNTLQLVAAGGPVAMTLSNTKQSLISSTNQGTDADFMLNSTIHITRSSNVISDVVPGLSFTLKQKTTGSVILNLTSDPSKLSSALQALVTNYNAVVDQVQQQTGQSGGPLEGDNTLRNITDDMRQLTSYWVGGNNSVKSLYDVGITFDDFTGHLTFNQSRFDSLSTSQMTDAFNYFGASKGFNTLAQNFTQLSDPTLGMIRLEENGLDTENTHIDDQVAALNTRNAATQAVMNAKLQQADALCAELQSQQTSLNAAIQSINYVTYGKVTTTGQ